jgi:hypothetical protein
MDEPEAAVPAKKVEAKEPTEPKEAKEPETPSAPPEEAPAKPVGLKSSTPAATRALASGATASGTSSDSAKAKKERVARSAAAAKPPCFNAPIQFVRGTEEEKLSITKCDGTPVPHAVDALSILLRPGNVQRPEEPIEALEKNKGAEVSAGIRRVDPKLVERLQQVVTHFAKAGHTTKVHLVSGYRPTSVGSFHADGKAMDFRIEGVSNERLVEQCKQLEDTGCGYYPNSSFIHLDVRDAGAGHVSWIDASGPGEKPRYVQSWPPKDAPTPAWIADTIAKLASDTKDPTWAGKIGF